MVRFVPGVAAAAAALVALKLTAPIDSVALWLEVVIYAAVYLAAVVAVDRAMARYGRHRERVGDP